jgi:hypothetical protein
VSGFRNTAAPVDPHPRHLDATAENIITDLRAMIDPEPQCPYEESVKQDVRRLLIQLKPLLKGSEQEQSFERTRERIIDLFVWLPQSPRGNLHDRQGHASAALMRLWLAITASGP